MAPALEGVDVEVLEGSRSLGEEAKPSCMRELSSKSR